MESEDINLDQLMQEAIGSIEIVFLISSLIVLCVYFNLAFNAFKLLKHTALPGSKILAYSCLFLAIFSVPALLLLFSTNIEDYVLLSVLSTTVTTLPIVTGAYGFGRLVRALAVSSV